MKMKLSQVLNINQVLKSIIDDSDVSIDLLTKFKFLGILKSIEPHINNFEIIRNDKIMEFGENTDDGSVRIDHNNKEIMQKFNDELLKVLDTDVEILFEKVKAENIFNKGIDANQLMVLYPFIEE